MTMARRALILGGVAVILTPAALVSAERSRIIDLYDEPRAIIETILGHYADNTPAELTKLPFVPRIQMALARTDYAIDPVINAADFKLTGVMVAPTRMIDDKRAAVEAHFLNFDKVRAAVFEFDRTSGDWLITDVRHSTGETLRSLLQIPPPR